VIYFYFHKQFEKQIVLVIRLEDVYHLLKLTVQSVIGIIRWSYSERCFRRW